MTIHERPANIDLIHMLGYDTFMREGLDSGQYRSTIQGNVFISGMRNP